MKIIFATFIGADKSLGFESGKQYRLKLVQEPDSITMTAHPSGSSGAKPCAYTPAINFFDNWSNIKTP